MDADFPSFRLVPIRMTHPGLKKRQIQFCPGGSKTQLATANTVFYAAPILVMVLSVILFREKLTPLSVFAVFSGFGGIVVILRPVEFNWAAIAALASAFALAINAVMVRRLPKQQSTVHRRRQEASTQTINELRQSVAERRAAPDTLWGRCRCCNRTGNECHGHPGNGDGVCSNGVCGHDNRAFSGGTSYVSNHVCVVCAPCFSSHACDPGDHGGHPHLDAGMTATSCGGVCFCRGPLSGGTLPYGSPAGQSLPQPGW